MLPLLLQTGFFRMTQKVGVVAYLLQVFFLARYFLQIIMQLEKNNEIATNIGLTRI